MPTDILPMMAIEGYESFTDVHYAFEINQEGIRTIAFIDNGNVRLMACNKDLAGKYTQITAAMQKWQINAVLDGKIIMLDNYDRSDINALRAWRSDEDGPLYYFVFDLLWYNGIDYLKDKYHIRKSSLQRILPHSLVVVYHDQIRTYGDGLFRHAISRGHEGIVAKRLDSVYQPGKRSKDWIHIPVKIPIKSAAKSKKR